ncbi:MAG: hypothetical protein FWH18_03710 [Marinilabiliaceae bacterium]|nr:hypothetical protein [Marinilabiliaceae bacterium]
MKLPIHIAEKLLILMQGKTLPASSVKHAIIEEMIAERIIERKGRIQKKLSALNTNTLSIYLHNKFSVNNLERYIQTLQKRNLSRAEAIKISSDSKLMNIRTFKGFLINCYNQIQVSVNEKQFVLNPVEGTFQFIYDFENFIIPKDITIVGIENPENFRQIEKQKYLFKNITPLFISRYPQSQKKDLLKWLQSIPNTYLHFGDFDFAGIAIYLNEYKKHLGDKATLFIPENIDYLFENYGNKNLYDNQKIKFDTKNISEIAILKLIKTIHKHKKGLEQEIFVGF